MNQTTPSKTVRCHTVPQRNLREFSDDGGRVWHYGKSRPAERMLRLPPWHLVVLTCAFPFATVSP